MCDFEYIYLYKYIKVPITSSKFNVCLRETITRSSISLKDDAFVLTTIMPRESADIFKRIPKSAREQEHIVYVYTPRAREEITLRVCVEILQRDEDCAILYIYIYARPTVIVLNDRHCHGAILYKRPFLLLHLLLPRMTMHQRAARIYIYTDCNASCVTYTFLFFLPFENLLGFFF